MVLFVGIYLVVFSVKHPIKLLKLLFLQLTFFVFNSFLLGISCARTVCYLDMHSLI